jgi:hypothetical protein
MNLNFSRKLLFGIGAAALVAAVPIAAFAQGAPPSPPTTYYGTANGATAGQSVIATIGSGASTRFCGSGTVTDEPGDGIVYVIDVEQDSTISGCGASGRQIRLYFTPTASAPGAFATQTLTWQPAGAEEQNVTLGTAFSNRIMAPGLRANP